MRLRLRKIIAIFGLCTIFSISTAVVVLAEQPPRVTAIAPSCAAPGAKALLSGHGFGAQNITIMVGNYFAQVLKATGNTAEFLVPTNSLPGFTKVTAINPGGQTGSLSFQVKGTEICANGIDDDCDGLIDEPDECPLAAIEVETSPFDIKLKPGEKGNISTSVSFVSSGTTPFTTAVTQQIVALSGSSSGISIAPNVGSGFVSTTDKATVNNQEITALSDGVYEIITTAKIVETGKTATTKARVTVDANPQKLSLGVPGSVPSALATNSTIPVVFTAQVQGADFTSPVNVQLSGNVVATLNDQGINGDIAAGDGTFSGTVPVTTTGLPSGSCLAVTATAAQGSNAATSDPYSLCVTSFPRELAPSNMAITVPDPVSGQPAIANEVLIVVVPGTSETRIAQIASSVGGVIVGSMSGLNIYQIRLASPVTSTAQLSQVMANLKALSGVISVEANVIGKVSAVTPSDSQFSAQDGVKRIRADEAWTITRGTTTIAIVDSGADLDHPDLSAKIIKGRDFVDGDSTPEDQHGHGTHVAGIASASTNNGVGIAGVSWNSKLLVVRAIAANGSITAANAVSGITYAADQGARIINASFEFGGGSSLLCSAVSYAISKGSLFIAAAGNQGTSAERYPAACAGAIAVGNTTLSDARNASSSFGSWVDLAAPGTNILSTVPIGGTCTFCNSSGYAPLTGTSMSAPMVSGAAAVLLSREPNLTNAEVETRLKRTAVKLPSQGLGAGRIDLFEAVFNGSFEEGNLALWERKGTASSKTALGSIKPQDRERMGSVSTGPSGTQVSGTLSQKFTIQPGVTSFPIGFKYAFITEEYPEFVGTVFDDSLKIILITPSGNSITLAEESVNASSFSPIGGIDFPEGDNTVGWTGWKSVGITIPVTEGFGTYEIMLQDAGDSIFDTEVLIDEINFK